MRLLLHICCGPCAIYPMLKLKGLKAQFSCYFYNPYIYPASELALRIKGAIKATKRYHVPLVINRQTDYDLTRKQDCSHCYDFRLNEVFAYAQQRGYTHVSSSLLGSPFQKHDQIIAHMQTLAKQYQLAIYCPDFKEGFAYGQKLARKHEIYCQKYCGCYSSYKALLKAMEEKND